MALENAESKARQLADEFYALTTELDQAGHGQAADTAQQIADAADDLAIVIGRSMPALSAVA